MSARFSLFMPLDFLFTRQRHDAEIRVSVTMIYEDDATLRAISASAVARATAIRDRVAMPDESSRDVRDGAEYRDSRYAPPAQIRDAALLPRYCAIKFAPAPPRCAPREMTRRYAPVMSTQYADASPPPPPLRAGTRVIIVDVHVSGADDRLSVDALRARCKKE